MFSKNVKKTVLGVVVVAAFSITVFAVKGNVSPKTDGGTNSMNSDTSTSISTGSSSDISTAESSSSAPVISSQDSAQSTTVKATFAPESSSAASASSNEKSNMPSSQPTTGGSTTTVTVGGITGTMTSPTSSAPDNEQASHGTATVPNS